MGGGEAGLLLRKIFGLSGVTFASRLLGFLREVLTAGMLGGGLLASAWSFAFTIPNLCRRVFGEGLLAPVLVPVFRHTMTEANGESLAKAKFSTVVMWLTLILSVISVIVSCASLGLALFLNEPRWTLALKLIPLIMPYCVFICLFGVMTAYFNSVRIFALPAAFSLILNICMICALAFVCPLFSSDFSILGALAASVLISGVVEVALMLFLLKKRGAFPEISLKRLADVPALKEIATLILPGLAGAVAYQLGVIFDRTMAMSLGDRATPALYFSERLTYLPIGVLAAAFGTVSLTEMSERAAKREFDKLVSIMSSAMRYLMFFTIPLAVYMFVFSRPLIEFVFMRGKFGVEDLEATSYALRFYALGIPAFAAMKISLGGFYSQKEMKTPMYVSICCIVLNVVLNFILMGPLRQGGIALATCVSSYVNNIALLLLLNRKIGGMPFVDIEAFIGKSLAVSVAAAPAAAFVFQLLEKSGMILFVRICASGTVYLALFFILAILLKFEELDAVRPLMRKLLPKGK